MRAQAHRRKSSKAHDLYLLQEGGAAGSTAAPRSAAARSYLPLRPSAPRNEPASASASTSASISISIFAEPPVETDAWWLSRSPTSTFARRRIALSDECARALQAAGDALAQIIVEFNGARFGGAALAANDGRYQLELGDALAQEMAATLDEDDGLAVELIAGRGQPTLAIHPYVIDAC
jgi:hypothetical protein